MGKIRFELLVPGFFALKLKDLDFEDEQATGRCYFLHRGRIVAVGRRM